MKARNKWPIYSEVCMAIHREDKRRKKVVQILLGKGFAFQDKFFHVEAVEDKVTIG